MLPGWRYDIDSGLEYDIYDPAHPHWGQERTPITSMRIIEQEAWDEEDDQLPITLEQREHDWHIQANTYGEATLEYTYKSADGTQDLTDTFVVHVNGDVYELEVFTDSSGMLPVTLWPEPKTSRLRRREVRASMP